MSEAFVPFTVLESDVAELRKFLDEIPMKYGLQVLIWMDQLEKRALTLHNQAVNQMAEKPKF